MEGETHNTAAVDRKRPIFTKKLRERIWKAIKNDDADRLFGGSCLHSRELVSQAGTGLWDPRRRYGTRRKQLLLVLASNVSGMPDDCMSLSCLEQLLGAYRELYTEAQLCDAARRAEKHGRTAVVEAIRHLLPDGCGPKGKEEGMKQHEAAIWGDQVLWDQRAGMQREQS